MLDVKLRYLDDDNDIRRTIAKAYYDGISNPLISLPLRTDDDQNVYHIFPIFTQHRDQLQDYLLQHGIQTQIHYPIPPHQQQCYKSWNNLSLPVTERIHQQELSLPIGPAMTEREVQQVISAVNSFV